MTLAVSDTVALSLISAAAGLIGPALMVYMQYKTRIAIDKGTSKQIEIGMSTAGKVAEVKSDLATATIIANKKVDNLGHVAKATHSLVDGHFTIVLRSNAKLARGMANIKPTEEYEMLAREAEHMLAEHLKEQAKVDDMPGTDAQKKGEG